MRRVHILAVACVALLAVLCYHLWSAGGEPTIGNSADRLPLTATLPGASASSQQDADSSAEPVPDRIAHGSGQPSAVGEGGIEIRAVDSRTGVILPVRVIELNGSVSGRGERVPAMSPPLVVPDRTLGLGMALVCDGYELALLRKGQVLDSPIHFVAMRRAGFLEIEFTGCEPAWFLDNQVLLSISWSHATPDLEMLQAAHGATPTVRAESPVVRIPRIVRCGGSLRVVFVDSTLGPMGQIDPVSFEAFDDRVVIDLSNRRDVFAAVGADVQLRFLSEWPSGAMKLQLCASPTDVAASIRFDRDPLRFTEVLRLEKLPAGRYFVSLIGDGFAPVYLGEFVQDGVRRSVELVVPFSGRLSVTCAPMQEAWTISIDDPTGRPVDVKACRPGVGRIDFPTLAAGDYFLTAASGTFRSVTRRVQVIPAVTTTESMHLLPCGRVTFRPSGVTSLLQLVVRGEGVPEFPVIHAPEKDLFLPTGRWWIEFGGRISEIVLMAGATVELR